MKKEVESEDLSCQSLENESNEEPFTHVTMKILGYRSEDVEDLDVWMRYLCCRSLEDMVQDYFTEMLNATYKHDFYHLQAQNVCGLSI